jgi:hypothetical protein
MGHGRPVRRPHTRNAVATTDLAIGRDKGWCRPRDGLAGITRWLRPRPRVAHTQPRVRIACLGHSPREVRRMGSRRPHVPLAALARGEQCPTDQGSEGDA